jgi:hypothetical protein
MLDILSEVDAVMLHLGPAGGVKPDLMPRALALFESLVAARTRADALANIGDLPPEIPRRWLALIRVCDEFIISGKEWPKSMRTRALSDLVTFTNYIRATITAVLLGEPLPPHVDPPNLQRPTDTKWRVVAALASRLNVRRTEATTETSDG